MYNRSCVSFLMIVCSQYFHITACRGRCSFYVTESHCCHNFTFMKRYKSINSLDRKSARFDVFFDKPMNCFSIIRRMGLFLLPQVLRFRVPPLIDSSRYLSNTKSILAPGLLQTALKKESAKSPNVFASFGLPIA